MMPTKLVKQKLTDMRLPQQEKGNRSGYKGYFQSEKGSLPSTTTLLPTGSNLSYSDVLAWATLFFLRYSDTKKPKKHHPLDGRNPNFGPD